MSRTEKAPATATPQTPRIRWQFAPDVPTYDSFEGIDRSDAWNLHELVEDFIDSMQDHQFHAWEGVICKEQGIPPTAEQEQAADELLN